MTKETETTEEEKYDGELPYTVKFKYPVQVGKETTLSELTFTEIPDAKSVSKMPTSGDLEVGALYPMIAAMTKTPESHILKIKWPDLKECFPVVNYFLTE